MIDIHCHILPGIDDGSEDLEMSLAMANAAVRDGITHILATPHHRNPAYVNKRADIQALVDQFQIELDKRGIDLIIFPSQEVRIHGEIMDHIEEGEILFADLDETYLLIEFPSSEVPAYTDTLFFELLTAGIRPVIVHPERNTVLMNNLDKLAFYINQGCYAQVTSASYLGEFGDEVQRVSREMIERQLVHVMASDAHRPDGARGFQMAAAFNQLTQEYGHQLAFDFKQNAKNLVNGDELVTNFVIDQPKKKKGLFGLFNK